VQWLYPASPDVLERLVEVLPSTRISLLVNYRPNVLHDWGGSSVYRQMTIGPLSAKTTAEFIDALLGNDVSVKSLRNRLVINTGGNPFCIEECIRSCAFGPYADNVKLHEIAGTKSRLSVRERTLPKP
jgi:predicted ATPase